MAVDDVASRSASYGFPGFVVDGMDLTLCYEATREAIKHAREQGPVLLEMKVERFMPHTTDDDDRRYRPADEVEEARQRDPVVSLAALLVEQGAITEQQIKDIKARATKLVNEATDAAEAAGLPDVSTIQDLVYAP
jgi:2-oxoisovalerate dehydrogenase E1 component alpha subunit